MYKNKAVSNYFRRLGKNCKLKKHTFKRITKNYTIFNKLEKKTKCISLPYAPAFSSGLQYII